jgi:hypothetical protein
MKKAFLFGSALLVCGALAMAQDNAPAAGSADSNSTSGNTVQGCLSGTSGAYTLTDASGATYQLQGDESQMSANVNKEVEVMGTMGSKASASATNSPDTSAPASPTAGEASSSAADNSTSATGATATASVAKTLSVTSIRKVADSCSAGGNQTPQQ